MLSQTSSSCQGRSFASGDLEFKKQRHPLIVKRPLRDFFSEALLLRFIIMSLTAVTKHSASKSIKTLEPDAPTEEFILKHHLVLKAMLRWMSFQSSHLWWFCTKDSQNEGDWLRPMLNAKMFAFQDSWLESICAHYFVAEKSCISRQNNGMAPSMSDQDSFPRGSSNQTGIIILKTIFSFFFIRKLKISIIVFS